MSFASRRSKVADERAPDDAEAVANTSLGDGSTHIDDASARHSSASCGMSVDVEGLTVVVRLNGVEMFRGVVCASITDTDSTERWPEKTHERSLLSSSTDLLRERAGSLRGMLL